MDPSRLNGPNGRELTRAERFEDEKRRIIESCFSKKDEDGSILETYITHIRITEYSSHPTTPPPPQARTPQTQKPRVIIVAVRKSGRVRMHKSKENPNGTFSIGKTWNLDDLGGIESFTGPAVSTDFKAWAGEVGFVVTLGKPYYWQAQTDKEKKFFIASLIKIYGKYTGGRMPALTGFDQREQEQVLGGAQRRLPPQQFSPQPPPTKSPYLSERGAGSSPMVNQPPGPDRPPFVPPFPSRSPMPEQPGAPYRQNGPEYPRPPPSRSQVLQDGSASPSGSFDSLRSGNQAPLRRLAAGNQSQDSVAASSLTARSDDGASLSTSRSRDRPPPMNGAPSYGSMTPSEASPREERPPERKRPPMDPGRPQGLTDDGLVPAPLMSSGMRREPVVPPRSVARKPSIASRAESLQSERPTPSIEQSRFDAAPANGAKVEDAQPAATPPPPVAAPAAAEEAPETPVAETPTSPEEESRPGLGPMIKKKKSRGEIKGAFWKAASTAGAFRPRPGGAGDRLRQAQEKATNEPDGITSVVPAPPRPVSAEKPKPAAPEEAQPKPPSEIPQVKITVPPSSRPTSGTIVEKKDSDKTAVASQEAKEKENANRRSMVVGNDIRYLASLGVDPTLLDKRSQEFTKWLDHFGWVPGDQMRMRNFDELKVDIERELNKAQAGGWLARFREEDDRVEAIKKGIDVSIQECEELDNLLTLYSVELSTLSDDIAYIEAQGQGLQVQAANQKLLKKELESLLDTCAITSADLEPLRVAPLENTSALEEIEGSLVTLYKAMLKIDPTMGNPDTRKSEDDATDPIGLNSDYGKMRMVQEKKEMYLSESATFMRRFVAFMAGQFDEAFSLTKRAVDGPMSKKADPRNHEMGRDILWKYNPLVLYSRDVDLQNWNRVIQIYQDKSHPIYKSEFRDALDSWKRNSKAAINDDSELLFTSQQQEKQEGGGVVMAARKMTVKRTQNFARNFRNESKASLASEKSGAGGHPHSQAWEAFAGAMDELLPLVEMEQNFVVDFFHATTLEHLDFPDAVASVRPQNRRGGDLRRHRLMEPDRELARRVTRAMEVIFSFLEQELQKFIDWVLSSNPIQGVGVLATLERKMADMSQSNQDFLNNILQKLHSTLEGRFKKFVDEQIRAIEETKVKIKKRKGVIPFIRIFPNFSAAVENMLVDVDPMLGVRRTVDREYERILKSMFDSVKVIARDNPAVSAAAANSLADPEDKEALNFHILLIENMNYFLDEVSRAQQQQHPPPLPGAGGSSSSLAVGQVEVLEDWKEAAATELAEHMSLYLNAVMRRPLGKLLEHLENVEAQLASGKSAAAVAAQPSNNKAVFNKVLGGYDAREVRKGLEALRKRVEKHFGDVQGAGDDSSLGTGGSSSILSAGSGAPLLAEHAQGLVNRVLRECERFYGDVELRISNITTNVYGGDVLFEWPRAEVKAAFANIGR